MPGDKQDSLTEDRTDAKAAMRDRDDDVSPAELCAWTGEATAKLDICKKYKMPSRRPSSESPDAIVITKL